MALIKCSDCHKEISDLAPACPNCGRPNPNQVVTSQVPNRNQVVTMQATGKLYKAMQAIGVLLSIIGVVSCIASAYSTEPSEGGNSTLLIGVAVYLIGRIGAWWHHR
jgi:hypothetical protein